MKKQYTISTTLISSTILILLLVFAVGISSVIGSSKVVFEKLIKDDMESILIHTKEYHSIKIKDLITELNAISKSRNILQYFENQQIKLVTEEFINYIGHFKALTYLDANTQPIVKVANGNVTGKTPDIESKFRKELLAKAILTPNKVIYSDIVHSKLLDKPSKIFAINVVNYFDENVGFILGIIPMDSIFEKNILLANKGYRYRVLDKNNNMVFTTLENDSLIKVNNNYKNDSFVVDNIKDVEYYIYCKEYEFGKVIVSLPYSYFKDMVNDAIKANISTFILLMIISVALMYYVARRITRPLSQLIEQLNNNSSKLKVRSRYKDISILSYTFNKQRRSLINLNQNLEQKVKDEVDKNFQKEMLLMEQSKMANMGAMIGNIAHQWRQPLSTISAAASGLKVKYELDILKDDDIPKTAEDIAVTIKYLSTTIDTFRNFLREKKEFKEVVLQDRIDIALNIAGLALKDNNIKLQNNVNYETPIKVKLITGELCEVVINIINNARDILIEKNIEAGWVKLDIIEQNNKAIITIEDNGGGIPEDILPNIFDEYFTTKDESQGTGLGLHMSYQIIVRSLKGKLYVKNTQYGAKFYIELPID